MTEDGPLLAAYGEIDLTNADRFREAVTRVGSAARRGTLTLDLRGTDFIDSGGLEAIVYAYKRRLDVPYALRALVLPRSQPERMLTLCGLEASFPILHLAADASVPE